MSSIENEIPTSDEHSISLSEKDFKELIEEIDKVRNQSSSNSETEEKSKDINTNSSKSRNEEEKSSSKHLECIPNQNVDKSSIEKTNEEEKIDDSEISDKHQKNSLLLMNFNTNNKINNYYNRLQLNSNENFKNGANISNINGVNNLNNYRTNIYNHPYYSKDNNDVNIFAKNNNSLSNNYNNNVNINCKLNHDNFIFGNRSCFNYKINNNFLNSIINNQILNNINNQRIQENMAKNINYPCNYVYNLNNNNLNFLLDNEIKNQFLILAQNNNKNAYQNLLLNYLNNNLNSNMNSINNIPIPNCLNINNININNQFQFNSPENNTYTQANLNNDLFSANNTNNINKQTQLKYSNKKSSNTHTRKRFKNKESIDISKNQIKLMDIFLCKDNRTTLMIKNIPNKYNISSFLDEINIYFKNTYDVFYLPIDYANKCNLGFAFINFVEPLHIILFYELYSGKKWKKFKSDKRCELLYAKFQNKKELISHFEKGKVLHFDSLEKRPLILPTPKVLPNINIPFCYLELFKKLYPNVSYEIKEFGYLNDNKNNEGRIDNKNNIYGKANNFDNIIFVFSINGNFNMHEDN